MTTDTPDPCTDPALGALPKAIHQVASGAMIHIGSPALWDTDPDAFANWTAACVALDEAVPGFTRAIMAGCAGFLTKRGYALHNLADIPPKPEPARALSPMEVN